MTRKLTLSTVEQEKKQAQLVEETKDLPMFDAVQKFADAGFELSESAFDQKVGSPFAMDRLYIATHGTDAHRDQLVKDDDAMVRFGVAKTGHLTHLAQLANDPHPMVRDQVARRGDEELAKKLSEDPHPMVRSSAYNRMQEIRRTIDDPAVISSANGVNESVEEPKHFKTDDTIQVKADGRFATIKTFFEAKDGAFWYAVSLPGGGSEVLHESEVRDLNESFKVTHYEASAHHTSTGSTDTGVYPFLPEHGADETGLDYDAAKAVIDKLNAKGDKGSIKYRYSLRTEDALKALDAKKLAEDRESEHGANLALAGDNSASKPNKPVKLKRADGTIHSTHDNEHSAMQAYKNEPDNKGMKIVRESIVETEVPLLEMGGGGGGYDAENEAALRIKERQTHEKNTRKLNAMVDHLANTEAAIKAGDLKGAGEHLRKAKEAYFLTEGKEDTLQEGFANECPFCNPALMESADQQILTEEHEAALVYHDQQAQRTDLPALERHFHVRCFNKHKRSI